MKSTALPFALTGLVAEKDLDSSVPVDFFYVREFGSLLCCLKSWSDLYSNTRNPQFCQPDLTCDQVIAFGASVLVTAKAYDIPETYAELNLSAIEAVSLCGNQTAGSRDIDVKAEVTHQEVVDAIQAAGVKRWTDIKLLTLVKTRSWHGSWPIAWPSKIQKIAWQTKKLAIWKKFKHHWRKSRRQR